MLVDHFSCKHLLSLTKIKINPEYNRVADVDAEPDHLTEAKVLLKNQ